MSKLMCVGCVYKLKVMKHMTYAVSFTVCISWFRRREAVREEAEKVLLLLGESGCAGKLIEERTSSQQIAAHMAEASQTAN